ERHQVRAHAVEHLLARRRDLELELALVVALLADVEPDHAVRRAGRLHGFERVGHQARVDQVAFRLEGRDDLLAHRSCWRATLPGPPAAANERIGARLASMRGTSPMSPLAQKLLDTIGQSLRGKDDVVELTLVALFAG